MKIRIRRKPAAMARPAMPPVLRLKLELELDEGVVVMVAALEERVCVGDPTAVGDAPALVMVTATVFPLGAVDIAVVVP